MDIHPEDALAAIAHEQAAAGDAWPALHVQMTADTLRLRRFLEDHPGASFDPSPVAAVQVQERATLTAVLAEHRSRLAAGLDAGEDFHSGLAPFTFTDCPLDPLEAGSFAAGVLAGRTPEAYAAAEADRARTLGQLADRLTQAGEGAAAERARTAALHARFVSDHAAAASDSGDEGLALLNSALLLAAYYRRMDPAAAERDILARATLTP